MELSIVESFKNEIASSGIRMVSFLPLLSNTRNIYKPTVHLIFTNMICTLHCAMFSFLLELYLDTGI